MDGRNITKIVRNMSLYKNKVKNLGLNENEFEIVRYLTKHSDGLSQSQLAEYLNVDKALVARMIKKLKGEGYVIIEPCESDSRKKIVKGTSKTKDAKDVVYNEEIDFYRAIFAVLSEAEKEKLSVLIEKIYLESKRLRKTNFRELCDDKK